MLRPETVDIIKDALEAERKHLNERPLLTLGQQGALKAMVKHFPGTVGAVNAQQRLDIHTAVKPAYALIEKIEALLVPNAAKSQPKRGSKQGGRRSRLRDKAKSIIISDGVMATGELSAALKQRGVQHNETYLSTLLNTSPIFERNGDGKWQLAVDMKDEVGVK